MMKRSCLLLAAFMPVAALATLSPAARLIPAPEGSLFWRTYMSSGAGITWEWPQGAVSAKLTVTGKSGTREVILTPDVTSYVPDVPMSFEDEDVCDFCIAFYAEEGAGGDPLPGETLEAKGIGIVRGVGGAALDLRSWGTSTKKWAKVTGMSAVFPVPQGTTALSCNGIAQPVAFVPGWHLCSPIVSGAEWSLDVEGESYGSCRLLTSVGLLLFLR